MGAALAQLAALVGLNPAAREADAPEPEVIPQFVRDMSFYFGHNGSTAYPKASARTVIEALA
ncbi:hypothetical protein [Amycolatopsis echigonensis]|uniref:hypothetical protein n=1 Tax=Amycolatopsis echigonensis TaxID=2576905 RepID=UPI0011788E01|nr:hypothetical protein [Amycolatopsis niigatensis]